MFVGVCVCVFVCVCVRLYACSYYIYKMFPHTEMHSLFHSISFKKKQDLSKQNKMSNITTEMKTLELSTNIDHSFMFNSKVSSIVDEYLFNKEITEWIEEKERTWEYCRDKEK